MAESNLKTPVTVNPSRPIHTTARLATAGASRQRQKQGSWPLDATVSIRKPQMAGPAPKPRLLAWTLSFPCHSNDSAVSTGPVSGCAENKTNAGEHTGSELKSRLRKQNVPAC